MSTGEELCIYHDTVSPLSYSSAPHGSCHTLKGQENRLNMVRLAFLLAKLRGVWARCRWAQLKGAECVSVCVCVGCPPGDGERNVIPNRTWCQLEAFFFSLCQCDGGVLLLRRFSWNVECFSSLLRPYFHEVSCSKEFPPKTLCVTQKPQGLVCMWLLVCLNGFAVCRMWSSFSFHFHPSS